MVLAILYFQVNQDIHRQFVDTPENHWVFEVLQSARGIAEMPGFDSHRRMHGPIIMSRLETAFAWLEAFNAVSRQHKISYLTRTIQYPYSDPVKLTKRKAQKLHEELEFVYEGLYKIQPIFENEIRWMTRPENREAIEEAKLELRVIHLERTLPASMFLPRKVNMDLRDVAYEDEK